MFGCLRIRVRKQPTIAVFSESETVLKFYNLEAVRRPNHLSYLFGPNFVRSIKEGLLSINNNAERIGKYILVN